MRPGSLSRSADADAMWRAEPQEQPETELGASFGLQHERTQLPTPAAANLPSSQTASPTPLITRRFKLQPTARRSDTQQANAASSNKPYCTETLAAARQSGFTSTIKRHLFNNAASISFSTLFYSTSKCLRNTQQSHNGAAKTNSPPQCWDYCWHHGRTT